MKRRLAHPIAIALILCISIIAGLIINTVWNVLEKKFNPRDYSDHIAQYSAQYGIPEYVVYAVIKVESGFDPNAISNAGARGLMQMMPSTFEWLTSDEHLNENYSPNDLYDPEVSIKYGTYYLKYLYSKFDYNWDTTFAAYNGGEGNVSKWLEDERYSDGDGNLVNIPFEETENYVRRVNSAIDSYKKLYY